MVRSTRTQELVCCPAARICPARHLSSRTGNRASVRVEPPDKSCGQSFLSALGTLTTASALLFVVHLWSARRNPRGIVEKRAGVWTLASIAAGACCDARAH